MHSDEYEIVIEGTVHNPNEFSTYIDGPLAKALDKFYKMLDSIEERGRMIQLFETDTGKLVKSALGGM